MRTINYKVNFKYETSDGEVGELSETKMNKEEVVRMLIAYSPLNYRDNLTNFKKLITKGSFMTVVANEGNEGRICTKILKITR